MYIQLLILYNKTLVTLFALGPHLLPSAKIDILYLLQYTERRVPIQEVRKVDKRTVKADGWEAGVEVWSQ
jgi:hypothetical protein